MDQANLAFFLFLGPLELFCHKENIITTLLIWSLTNIKGIPFCPITQTQLHQNNFHWEINGVQLLPISQKNIETLLTLGVSSSISFGNLKLCPTKALPYILTLHHRRDIVFWNRIERNPVVNICLQTTDRIYLEILLNIILRVSDCTFKDFGNDL